MLKSLRTTWAGWRNRQRQYAIERALYKAGNPEKEFDPYSKGANPGPPDSGGGTGAGGGAVS
jgi:hypothetical protein